MINTKRLSVLFPLAFVAAFGFLAACGDESAGKEPADAMEKAGDAIEEAGDEAEEAADEAADQLEEAADK